MPSMIELIIFYGGRLTPVILEYDNLLPLQIALLQMTIYHVSDWTPKDSIYKLIAELCVPVLQNRLESIGLLAEMTKETEEVFLEYAVEGKIIEFAALLMVAHKKFTKLMDRVRQCFDSSENNHHPIGEYQEKKVASMRQLVEVFDRAGDDISAYIKEDKFYVSARQSIVDVTRLLVKAGFQDADLSDSFWFRYGARSYYEGSNIGERCLNDFGMAHYSKSGYRWKVLNKDPWWRFFNVEAYINELKNETEGLKEENANIKKQQQQPNLRIWMDDELGKALEEDDREEFLSVIDRKLDFFHSRQQLLHAVCGYGSIKCAEALLKGDTRLTVELNHPCTDTGLYPLHCAALSLFPSIVELFIYYGARTDIEFRPCNPLDIYPQHLVEAHARKLPLHMALLAISRLPCIKEWSPKHTIAKLVTLLCLPRMQNPLETLNLLVRTTQDLEYVENEFTQLAIDGKVVEFAAMLSVANMKLSDIKGEVYEIIEGSIDDEDPTPNAESVLWLLRVFDDVGHHITKYIKEDKYNV